MLVTNYSANVIFDEVTTVVVVVVVVEFNKTVSNAKIMKMYVYA